MAANRNQQPPAKGDNFRTLTGGDAADALEYFFGQFEQASPGLVPIIGLADLARIERDERGTFAPAGSMTWWDGSPLAGRRDPFDALAHAREFRERMRCERSGQLINRPVRNAKPSRDDDQQLS